MRPYPARRDDRADRFAAGFARSSPSPAAVAEVAVSELALDDVPPRSKGRHFPADPPRTEEIIAVMRCCGVGLHGDRAVDRRSETTGALNNSSRGYRRARRCPSGRCSA